MVEVSAGAHVARRKRGMRAPLALLLAAPVALLAGLASAQAANGSSQPPTVVVVRAEPRDVTPEFRYVGRVEAMQSVELRARVAGYLQERAFEEGREVERGQLLFRIEAAPYEAIVAEREADVAAAEATLNLREVEYRRAEQLVERGVNSRESLDLAEAQRRTAEAGLLGARASLRRAELNLEYTTIDSPITGRIGLSRYTEGDYINEQSEPLATVTTLDPVRVAFQIGEAELLAERKRGIDLENPRVEPLLELSDGTRLDKPGRFDFLAPTVSRTTDTVTARAVFPNPDGVLLPGQFVTLIVRSREPQRALTVPQKALQRDSEGQFALVVGADDTVSRRRVTVGRQIGQDWVIEKGLAEGERVVVEGIQKVSDGAEVRVTEQVAQSDAGAGRPDGTPQ